MKTVENSYSSTVISFIINIFVAIITLILVIQIFGLDSMLQAGGVIGFIGVFFALTHSSWSPDIFSGLIIINSDSLKEGDVIQYTSDGRTVIGTVWRTKLFHTEILYHTNGHKVMIWNSKLKTLDIHNLTSKASSKGLRECVKLVTDSGDDVKKVRKTLEMASEQMQKHPTAAYNKEHETEIQLIKSGEGSAIWGLFYYVTAKEDIKHIVRTRQQFNEAVLIAAQEMNLVIENKIDVHVVKKLWNCAEAEG